MKIKQKSPRSARVVKLNGPKPWRVADHQGRPLRTRHGKPLDRGGYASRVHAENQADAINRATAANAREKTLAKVSRRQKQASRRAVKQAQRERLEQFENAAKNVEPEAVKAVRPVFDSEVIKAKSGGVTTVTVINSEAGTS